MRKLIKSYKMINSEEQNDFYDPRKSNNGGGYHQPYYEYELETHDNKIIRLEVDDTSCGDFGKRINIRVYDENDDRIACAYYGSMLKENDKYSSFEKDNELHLEIIEILDECGYRWVPTSDEFE